MASVQDYRNKLKNGEFDSSFRYLCCTDEAAASEKERCLAALDGFASLYGEDREVMLISAPGRTEIGGNHTDHQHGCVLAASVNLDVIAVVSRNEEPVIHIKSEGFDPDTVDVTDLVPHDDETGRSASLIRGMCAGFRKEGYEVCGFDGYATSNVLKGSGLSSSAAYEVLIGSILNHLVNDGRIDAVSIAKISQYSENVFFGKSCGLMDQTASAVGGFVAIDFNDPKKPLVRKVDYDLTKSGYRLFIVDTRGDHADLTDDYGAITSELKKISEHFGKSVLRDIAPADFYREIPALRKEAGDRAVLRAIHFYDENERAQKQADALMTGDFDTFAELVRKSGRSSALLLQNLYSASHPDRQEIPLALALTERFLGEKGIFRVHGGGFAGTMQAYIPADRADDYRKAMEAVFGEGCCYALSVRPVGAVRMDAIPE